MKLNSVSNKELELRVKELEAKELVIEGDFIGRKEVQQALDGMAQVMQQALVEQGQGLQQMINQSAQKNAQAVRVAVRVLLNASFWYDSDSVRNPSVRGCCRRVDRRVRS